MFRDLERGSWYLGNLLGVPVFVHGSALFLLLWTWQLVPTGSAIQVFILALIALVLSLLAHELGHALVARAFGTRGVVIVLWGFGGLCKTGDQGHIGREAAVVAAGPAVNLAFWLGGAALLPHVSTVLHGWQGAGEILFLLLQLLILINQLLFLFNILPIYPQDGGRLAFLLALGVTGNRLLARKTALTLAVFGALAFFCQQTGLFSILANGGDAQAWLSGLGGWDILFGLFLAWLVHNAFQILY